MKNIFCLCVFVCVSCQVRGQEWRDLFQQGVATLQAGKNQEAIGLLSKSKQQAEEAIGKNNINYFYLVTLLGRAYENNLEYKNAEKEFLQAYGLSKTLFPNNEEHFVTLATHNLAKNLYQQQNYAEAEKYAQEAYQLIKNEPQHQDYLSVCHTLGAIWKEQDKFDNAEKMFLEIKQRTSPDKSLYYDALNGLAIIHYKKNHFAEAEKAFLELVNQAEKHFGKNEGYASYCHNIGSFYKETSQFHKAEKYLKEALQLREKLLGTSHPDYALTCSYLGYVYQDLGIWDTAETLFRKAQSIYKAMDMPHDYLLVTNNLASLLEEKALYSQAEALYQEALQICEKILGKNHSAYGMLMANLAGLYYKQGFFAKAETAFQEALRTDEKIYGKNSLQYSQTRMNYAVFKLKQKESHFAEQELKSLLSLAEKNLGKENLFYLSILQNLALAAAEKEDYRLAEEYYLEAKKICEKVLGKANQTYLVLLNNFAQFYVALGNLESSLKLYQEIFELAQKIWTENHLNYAIALRNIAYIFTLQGEWQQAEKLCNQGLDIIVKNYGETQPEYLNSLNNLASIHFLQKKYKSTLTELQKAYQIAEKIYGKEHKLVGTILNNLAIAYIEDGDFKQALSYLQKSLAIKEKFTSKKHQEYLTAQQNLAWIYTLQNKFDQAEPIYKQVTNAQIEKIFKIFPILSEKEKIAFVNAQKGFFINYIDFCFSYASQKPAILGELLDFRLLTKGMVAEVSQDLRKKVYQQKNPQITALYNQWADKRNRYLALLNNPLQENAKELTALFQELELLEKELSKKVYFNKKVEIYSWKTLQKQLKPDEVAIEVIRTLAKNRANPAKTDTVYAFLVVSSQTTTAPELLFVPNAAQLETEQIALYTNAINLQKTNYYQELYDSFWGNVVKNSKILSRSDIKKIYFSPDGVYHKINLATLYNPTQKQFLGEYLEIYNLTNLKKLITQKANITATTKAYLIGYPDYQGSANVAPENNRGISVSIEKEKKKLSRFLDFENVSYLPGTKKETDEIAKILTQSNLKVTLWQSQEANEKAIKNIQSPDILHIATHGFFLEEVYTENNLMQIGQKEIELSKNPLLRAGLLLANCSQSLKKNQMNAEQEDGILTAYEVAQMNLQGTELVVLSACETGLGEIQNGEGVFGLQRAFLQAGAENLIISLWRVDDQATQEFMTLLYQNWKSKKMPLSKSFYEAQKEIRNRYTHPKYWGAFVMVE